MKNFMDVLEEQHRFQNQAKRIVARYKIIEYLSHYGRPAVVGSAGAGLMTSADIDIEVGLSKVMNHAIMLSVIKHFFTLRNVIKLITIDNTNRTQPRLPQGFYVGFRQVHQSGEWGIDVWFVNPGHMRGRHDLEWLQRNLDEGKRKIILEVKRAISTLPEYRRKEITSTDVYRAVLEGGVSTPEEFRLYQSKRMPIYAS